MIQDGKLRGFAMGHAIPVRTDYTSGEVRRFAQRAKDAAQARRLLAIAAVLEGASRQEAAKIGGMDRQTLRDWVIRFNEQGADGLIPRLTSRMPRPWTRSKKLRRACGGNPRAARTRHTGRGLVPRRDAGGPKEQAHLSLGQEGFTPPCRPRSKDPINLPVRCGLPRTRSRRRPRAAGLQHRSYAASPR